MLNRPGLAAVLYALCYAPFIYCITGPWSDPTAECVACFLATGLFWHATGLLHRAVFSPWAVAGGVCSALVIIAQFAAYKAAGGNLPLVVMAQRCGVLCLCLAVDRKQGRSASLWPLVLAGGACLCAALARWRQGPVDALAWAGTGLYLLGYAGKLWGAGKTGKAGGWSYIAAEQLVAAGTAAVVMLARGQAPSLDPRAWIGGVLAAAVGLSGAMLICSPRPHAWAVPLNRVAGILAVYGVGVVMGKSMGWWDGGAMICAGACAWTCAIKKA